MSCLAPEEPRAEMAENRSGLIHVTVLSVKGADALGLKAPFVELGLHATRHRTTAAKIPDGTSRKQVTWNEDFSLPFNSDKVCFPAPFNYSPVVRE